tara:strand:- start:58 stop:261 length:204 start_codon:yes stop_codon:yes gene_type:complete
MCPGRYIATPEKPLPGQIYSIIDPRQVEWSLENAALALLVENPPCDEIGFPKANLVRLNDEWTSYVA